MRENYISRSTCWSAGTKLDVGRRAGTYLVKLRWPELCGGADWRSWRVGGFEGVADSKS
jgi:hypothetical protein